MTIYHCPQCGNDMTKRADLPEQLQCIYCGTLAYPHHCIKAEVDGREGKEFDKDGNLWLHGSCARPNPLKDVR